MTVRLKDESHQMVPVSMHFTFNGDDVDTVQGFLLSNGAEVGFDNRNFSAPSL